MRLFRQEPFQPFASLWLSYFISLPTGASLWFLLALLVEGSSVSAAASVLGWVVWCALWLGLAAALIYSVVLWVAIALRIAGPGTVILLIMPAAAFVAAISPSFIALGVLAFTVSACTVFIVKAYPRTPVQLVAQREPASGGSAR
jgi:hypothetical protein